VDAPSHVAVHGPSAHSSTVLSHALSDPLQSIEHPASLQSMVAPAHAPMPSHVRWHGASRSQSTSAPWHAPLPMQLTSHTKSSGHAIIPSSHGAPGTPHAMTHTLASHVEHGAGQMSDPRGGGRPHAVPPVVASSVVPGPPSVVSPGSSLALPVSEPVRVVPEALAVASPSPWLVAVEPSAAVSPSSPEGPRVPASVTADVSPAGNVGGSAAQPITVASALASANRRRAVELRRVRVVPTASRG
jgi:hypothetical protein